MKVPRAAKILKFLLLFFMVVLSPFDLLSAIAAKGNIAGYVYDRDGMTPLEGAVVKAKNIVSGVVYESRKSNGDGAYLLENVEGGAYLVGVESPDGAYNSHGLVGLIIQGDVRAEMSFSLRPYEHEVATAIHDVYLGQKLRGEAMVAKVLNYDSQTGMAKIVMTKGLLKMNDRIHTYGRKTDFSQDLLFISREKKPVNIIFEGQNADILLKHKASPDDEIYVISKRRVLPLFLTPQGEAAIISRNMSIMQDMMTVLDEPIAASPFIK
jgi:hypothetical protein